MRREYHVYILASDSRELYVGVTGHLVLRITQHRTELKARGFTARHRTMRLVYCEVTNDVRAAIRREKQIKGWTRRRKLELIEAANPEWNDLAAAWESG
jgi:putative endonuclease